MPMKTITIRAVWLKSQLSQLITFKQLVLNNGIRWWSNRCMLRRSRAIGLPSQSKERAMPHNSHCDRHQESRRRWSMRLQVSVKRIKVIRTRSMKINCEKRPRDEKTSMQRLYLWSRKTSLTGRLLTFHSHSISSRWCPELSSEETKDILKRTKNCYLARFWPIVSQELMVNWRRAACSHLWLQVIFKTLRWPSPPISLKCQITTKMLKNPQKSPKDYTNRVTSPTRPQTYSCIKRRNSDTREQKTMLIQWKI